MTLYEQLVTHYNTEPTRKGENYIDCPHCGKPAEKKKCSFAEKGYKCFVCDGSGGLRKLAGIAGIISGDYVVPAHKPEPQKPKPAAPWKANAVSLMRQYEQRPGRWDAWNDYKPLSREAIIQNHLGLGVLPASRCKHDRLIVPILRDGVPVWFRGRSLGCDCGKWLTPGGVSMAEDQIPLYNISAVKPDSIVWIVENPIDALMLTERTEFVAVATYSVSYWFEEWAAALADAKPKWIVVAYDNDIPGNGGGAQHDRFAQMWREKHNGLLMDPNGPKLVNKLLRANMPARLYDWPSDAPMKADVGSVLMD